MRHPDVYLLASLTVTGKPTDEKIVASAVHQKGIVPGGVDRQGRGCVARMVA